MEANASAFVHNFGHYQDVAIKEPVIINSHNRVVGVFLSADDYDRLRRAVQRVHRAGELPPEVRAAIDEAIYPSDEAFTTAGLLPYLPCCRERSSMSHCSGR